MKKVIKLKESYALKSFSIAIFSVWQIQSTFQRISDQNEKNRLLLRNSLLDLIVTRGYIGFTSAHTIGIFSICFLVFKKA